MTLRSARASLPEPCRGCALCRDAPHLPVPTALDTWPRHGPHLDGDVEAAVRLAAGLALLAPALVELLHLSHKL